MEQEIQNSSRFNFSKIFEYCLWALVLLLPVFFYPSATVSLYSAKLAFLITVIVVFIAVFFASILSKGVIQIPKSKFLIPIVVFPVVALISSFFSGQIIKSIAGEIFELGTAGSLLILTALLFLAILVVRDSKTGLKTIYALFISAGVVVFHLILRVFAAVILPDAVAAKIPNFLLGGSIDTAIFLAATVIASLVAANMLDLGKKVRMAIYALLVASMIFIGAIGFTAVIVAIGAFALFYFVYTFSWSINTLSTDPIQKGRASFLSLFVLIFSIVLILSGGALSGYLSDQLRIASIEIRPNFQTTADLIGQAWQKNSALGTGPNMFKELWDSHRPMDTNLSQFWASSFNFGSSFVMTVAATTGILGLLSLLTFLFFYLTAGFKAIFYAGNDCNWRYLSLVSFLISLFFWTMAIIYTPSIVVISLMFLFTGVFAATLVPQGVVGGFKIDIFSNPKTNFVAVFSIIVLLIASVAGGYFVWERVVTASIYQKGVGLLIAGDNQGAKETIAKAINLTPNDLYWKTISEASLSQVGNLLSTITSPANVSDAQRVAIQNEIADAVESARQAINWNTSNYENWFVLGRVYEVLAANGIQGASENSITAFKEAQNRAPLNPAIPLALARLDALSGNLDGARANIGKAIELKNNYTDAYFTLTQLEVATNNIAGAIRSMEPLILMDPQNAALHFQLGLLKYNNQDYGGAAAELERAVSIVPDYANAQYFLGLSYDKLGKKTEAIAQFEAIQKTNPDNAEVVLILKNLKAGKAPFKDAQPPVDDRPERRTEPPIDEN